MTSTPPDTLPNRCRLDLACGLALLTRLPVSWLAPPASRSGTIPWPMARSIWCWPLIAAGLGAGSGCVLALLRMAHVPALAAAGLALACQTALTGALHEDGLADMADSFGATTPERRLAIMRDSRVGSYGVIALSLSLLVRAAALAALPVCSAIATCAITACLARMAMLLVPACTPPARPDGLARMLYPLPRRPLGLAVLGTMAVVLGLTYMGHTTDLPVWAYPAYTVVPMGISCAAAWLVARGAWRLLGGFTGDVLGGCAVLVECLLLSFYAALA